MIVLAYAGAPLGTVAIPWLVETRCATVVTVTLDLGHGADLEAVRERALAAGAARAHVLDAREAFARDYILPSLAADALDPGGCPFPSALSHAMVVATLVEMARLEGTDVIAHGSIGPDASRVESLATTLAPALTVLAPVRDLGTRAAVAEYARQHHVGVTIDLEPGCRVGTNLWGRTIDGVRGDGRSEPPDSIFSLTGPAAAAPDAPAYVELTFEAGRPTAVNGVGMRPTELIESLGTIAAPHGVGRMEIMDARTRDDGRRFCEAPAAAVLHAAREDLARFVLAPDVLRRSRELSMEYADVIDGGFWFTRRREALDAFFARAGEALTGTVRAKLFKGRCVIVGREAIDN